MKTVHIKKVKPVKRTNSPVLGSTCIPFGKDNN